MLIQLQVTFQGLKGHEGHHFEDLGGTHFIDPIAPILKTSINLLPLLLRITTAIQCPSSSNVFCNILLVRVFEEILSSLFLDNSSASSVGVDL